MNTPPLHYLFQHNFPTLLPINFRPSRYNIFTCVYQLYTVEKYHALKLFGRETMKKEIFMIL